MKSISINSADGKVFGHISLGHVISMGAVDVWMGDNLYRVCFENDETRVTVAVKGWPRKVKTNGTTGRRVLVKVLFPRAEAA